MTTITDLGPEARASRRCEECGEHPPRYRLRFTNGWTRHLCAACATVQVKEAAATKIGAEGKRAPKPARPGLKRMERTQRYMFDE